jgi:hypothetical protein
LVSGAENQRNKPSNKNVGYEFVNNISENAIEVNEYIVGDCDKREFKFLCFHEDIFFWYNGKQYRILHESVIKKGDYFV